MVCYVSISCMMHTDLTTQKIRTCLHQPSNICRPVIFKSGYILDYVYIITYTNPKQVCILKRGMHLELQFTE